MKKYKYQTISNILTCLYFSLPDIVVVYYLIYLVTHSNPKEVKLPSWLQYW